MTSSGYDRLHALPGHDAAAGAGSRIGDWSKSNARRFGDSPAIAGIDRSPLSHAGLYRHIRDIGDGLLERGIGRGDIVVIALPNGPEFLSAILAVASVAVALPIALEEPDEAIEQLLKLVSVKAMLFDAARQSALRAVAERRGSIQLPISIDGKEPAGVFHLPSAVTDSGARATATLPDDAAILAKTAGTTAEPKLVAWSQASIFLSVDAAATWMGLGPEDRSLCMMPFAHLHSVVRSTMPGLLRGGSAVCGPGFDRIRALDWITEHRPTYLTAVPGILRTLVARAAETGWTSKDSSLRFLASGSDSIDDATVQAAHDTFNVPIREFYGMSEVAPMLAASPAGRLAHTNGAVGQPLEIWSYAFLDEQGLRLPEGRAGEIAVRGGLINPVINRSGTTTSRFVDGWFLTGDLGHLDGDGQLHVSGRVDERITRGGKKIAPEAVEEALSAHPMIHQAVVFPIPDEILGARVGALIVPEQDAPITERDARVFVAGQLPDYMVPERLVIRDRVPESRVGKIARRGMFEQLGINAENPDTPAAGRQAPRTDTEAAVAGIVRDLLDQDQLDLEGDFMDSGGDSFLATTLLIAVEERFGLLLSPSQFLGNSSVVALARLIDSLSASADDPRIIRIQAGQPGKPVLFFAHAVFGGAYYAHAFAKHLGPAQPVHAFQWQEPDSSADGELTLETHAADYVSAMLAVQPTGPYNLAGHSFGAHLAYEVAQQLTAQGHQVAFLGLIDDEADLFMRRFGINKTKARSDRVYDRCKHLLDCYVPVVYPGSAVLFQAETKHREALADPYVGWRDLVLGGVRRIDVVGNHTTMMNESSIAHWADQLGDCLSSSIQRSGCDGRGPLLRPMPPAQRRQALLLARRAAKSADLGSEITEYRRAIESNPDQPYWVFRNLGAALVQNGAIEEAEQAYRRAIELEANPIVGYGELARVLRAAGRRREARQCIAAAASQDLGTAEAQCALGEILMADEAMDRAEQAFRKAIEIQPSHPFAHRRLSGILTRRGRLNEAISLAEKAVELMPDNDGFLFHLGNLLVQRGDFEAAESQYRRCIDLGSGNVYARKELCALLCRRGRLDEALVPAADAARLMPDNPGFRYHLANLLAAGGDAEAAVAEYGACVDLISARIKPRFARSPIRRLLATGIHRPLIRVFAHFQGRPLNPQKPR